MNCFCVIMLFHLHVRTAITHRWAHALNQQWSKVRDEKKAGPKKSTKDRSYFQPRYVPIRLHVGLPVSQ